MRYHRIVRQSASTLFCTVLAMAIVSAGPAAAQPFAAGAVVEVSTKTKLWPSEEDAEPHPVSPGEKLKILRLAAETALVKRVEDGAQGWIKLNYLRAFKAGKRRSTDDKASTAGTRADDGVTARARSAQQPAGTVFPTTQVTTADPSQPRVEADLSGAPSPATGRGRIRWGSRRVDCDVCCGRSKAKPLAEGRNKLRWGDEEDVCDEYCDCGGKKLGGWF